MVNVLSYLNFVSILSQERFMTVLPFLLFELPAQTILRMYGYAAIWRELRSAFENVDVCHNIWGIFRTMH